MPDDKDDKDKDKDKDKNKGFIRMPKDFDYDGYFLKRDPEELAKQFEEYYLQELNSPENRYFAELIREKQRSKRATYSQDHTSALPENDQVENLHLLAAFAERGLSMPVTQIDPGIEQAKNEALAEKDSLPAESVDKEALSAGKPLSEKEQADFAKHTDADLSSVRIHTDKTARDAAEHMNADAFTIGTDIAFAEGKYQPGTAPGKELLAHELTHAGEQKASGQPVVQRKKKPDYEIGEADLADLHLPDINGKHIVTWKKSFDAKIYGGKPLSFNNQVYFATYSQAKNVGKEAIKESTYDSAIIIQHERNYYIYSIKVDSWYTFKSSNIDAIFHKLVKHDNTTIIAFITKDGHILKQENGTLTWKDDNEMFAKGIVKGHRKPVIVFPIPPGINAQTLAEALRAYALRKRFPLIRQVLKEVSASTKEETAFYFINQSSMSELHMFASSGGENMLLSLYKILIKGNEEKIQASYKILTVIAGRIPLESRLKDLPYKHFKVFPFTPPGWNIYSAGLEAKLTPNKTIMVRFDPKVGVKPGVKDFFKDEIQTFDEKSRKMFYGQWVAFSIYEMVYIKRYDQGGGCEFKPALYLLQLSQYTKDALKSVAIDILLAPFMFLGSGGLKAKSFFGTVATILTKAMGAFYAASRLIEDNQGWIIKELGDEGKTIVKYSSIVKQFTMIYGIGRMVYSGGKLIYDYRKAHIAFKKKTEELRKYLDADKQKVLDGINKHADEYFEDVEKAQKELKKSRRLQGKIGGKALEKIPYRVPKNDYYVPLRNITDGSDIKNISKLTGLPESKIKAVKKHLMYDEHILVDEVTGEVYRGRFTPFKDIAEDWQKFTKGEHLSSDSIEYMKKLINHEFGESLIMRGQQEFLYKAFKQGKLEYMLRKFLNDAKVEKHLIENILKYEPRPISPYRYAHIRAHYSGYPNP